MWRFLIICIIIVGFEAGECRYVQASDEFTGAVPSLSIAVKWRLMQAQMDNDAARLVSCRADAEACSIEDSRLLNIVEIARERDGLARIGEINRTVNLAIRPVSDLQRFGVRDHWSAPLETLRDGIGDCEDYALVKYLALREAGFADDDVQFLIVRDPILRADHAVVAARYEGRWVVLDNRTMVLADLQSTLQFKRYRVLAQLGRDIDAPDFAGVVMPAPASVR